MKPGNLMRNNKKVLIPAVYPRDEDFLIKITAFGNSGRFFFNTGEYFLIFYERN